MQTFPNEAVCLEEHFTKFSFSPPFHLQEAACWHTFPSFSHIFFNFQLKHQDAASGFILLSLKTKVKEGAPKEIFFPQTGSFNPNLQALKQHLHCFWCPEHERKLLLWTEKSWVIKLASKYLVLPRFSIMSRSQRADFLECCILLQLAQLYQVSIELFHRSTSCLLDRPDRTQEMSSHSSSDC